MHNNTRASGKGPSVGETLAWHWTGVRPLKLDLSKDTILEDFFKGPCAAMAQAWHCTDARSLNE